MPQPVMRRKIVKKRLKKFHRFQADQFKRISRRNHSWRRPKGIDSYFRRQFRGYPLMPNIGYGTDKRTRHMERNGFYRYHVKNLQDLEMLLMHNGIYEAELASNLSAKKRREIIARADQLNVKVTNR